MSDGEIVKHVDLIYNLSDKCPMNGVSYDEERKQYMCVINCTVIYDENIKNICEMMKEDTLRRETISKTQIFQVNKKVIRYMGKYIVLFVADIDNEPIILFDTGHIAELLKDVDNKQLKEVIKNTEIYDVCIYFEPNEYNGYTVRNLINTDILCRIVIESKSKISESFEKDMNKIIGEIKPTQIIESRQLIQPITDEDIIMKQVDSNAGYNYSKEKPMDGVTYDTKRNRYSYSIDGKMYYSKVLEKVCQTKISNWKKKSDGLREILQTSKKVIEYQNKYLIVFWHDHTNELEPLFDIKHILKLLDVKESQSYDIKNKIDDNSKFIYFEPNEYNGYIVRELVNEKTLYQIVLDSRSAFSKSFKSDISDLLINMRKNGNIQFAGIVQPQRQQRTQPSDLSKLVVGSDIAIANQLGMKTTNIRHMQYVNYLIQKGTQIRVEQYHGRHVMYFYITDIKHDDDYVICKIGYTSDIATRVGDLSKEYGNRILYLLSIKCVKSQRRERKFHDAMKGTYPQLPYNVKISDIQKNELYIFDPCLLEEFNCIRDRINDIESLMAVHNILADKNMVVNMEPNTLNKLLDVYTKELEINRIKSEIKLMNIKHNLH
jgi:hypothetical protein